MRVRWAIHGLNMYYGAQQNNNSNNNKNNQKKEEENVRISFGKLMAMVCTMTVFYTLLSLAHSLHHLAQWLTISNLIMGKWWGDDGACIHNSNTGSRLYGRLSGRYMEYTPFCYVC